MALPAGSTPANAADPKDKDYVDLTKAEADELIGNLKVLVDFFKDSYVVTITGPTETPAGSGKYTVKVRFKKKN